MPKDPILCRQMLYCVDYGSQSRDSRPYYLFMSSLQDFDMAGYRARSIHSGPGCRVFMHIHTNRYTRVRYKHNTVLSQEQGGKKRVIAYASRTLTPAERNYSFTRRELLAVIHFVQQYKPYLFGKSFWLRTDHGSLCWLYSFKEPKGQVA